MSESATCKCVGIMLPWKEGLVYPDCPDPEKIVLRCVECGEKQPYRGKEKVK